MVADPDVSIVLTTHAERRGLLPTLRSLERSARHARDHGLVTELIVIQDSADAATVATFERARAEGVLGSLAIRVVPTSFADLSRARNRGVELASAELVMVMDGDNLTSLTWITDAVRTIREADREVIVHPELILTFGERREVWPLMASDDPGFHPGWMAWYNPWDAFAMAPRAVFERFPYRPAQPWGGFGPEDWVWNCDTVAAGVPHRIVPNTALFYYAKSWGSLAVLHRSSLLHRNALLRSREVAEAEVARLTQIQEERRREEERLQEQQAEVRELVDEPDERAEGRLAQVRLRAASAVRRAAGVAPLLRALRNQPADPAPLPSEEEHESEEPAGMTPVHPQLEDARLLDEWRAAHLMQPHVPYPSPATVASYGVWGNAWDAEFITDRLAYWTLVLELPEDLDILFIAPWIRTGGADLVTTQLITAVRAARPDARIGLITTEPQESTRLADLGPDVFVSWLGRFRLTQPWVSRVLGMIITQLRPQTVHVVNSYVGVEALDRFAPAIATQTRIFVSTFVLDRLEDGSTWSLLHHRSRDFFDHVSGILVDSKHFADTMSRAEGIDPDRFVPIHQAVSEQAPTRQVPTFGPERPLQVLWAGRFDRQKRLDRLGDVVEVVRRRGLPVEFTVLGEIVLDDDPGVPDQLARLRDMGCTLGPAYAGGFRQVAPERFDALLMTSDSEGVPNILLEAMASGLSVVAGDVGGVDEVVSGETGYLVSGWDDPEDFADALAALVADPGEASRRAGHARALMEREYSFEGLCGALEAIPAYLPDPRGRSGSHWYVSSSTESVLSRGAPVVLVYSGANGHSNFGDILQNKNILEYWKTRGDRTPVLVLPAFAAEPPGRIEDLRSWFDIEHILLHTDAPWHDVATGFRAWDDPSSARQDRIIHVVGGGYINQRWGGDHVRVIDALATDFAPGHILATGLQIDEAGADHLSALEQRHPVALFGFRDAESADLARRRLTSDIRFTFDDITETLIEWTARLRGAETNRDGMFALHLNTSDYTGGADARRRWLEVLQQVSGEHPGEAPLIISAYADPREEVKDSVRAMADFAEDWPFTQTHHLDLARIALDHHRGQELPEAASVLAGLRFAVVSSYHTSLLLALLGVPTYLLSSTPYFEQKSRLYHQPDLATFLEDPAAHRVDLDGLLERRAAWLAELDTLFRVQVF